ncbi:hypothetical protein LSAT2_015252 [Lamellibrachia satsuma]|nr:hypothetical protein LSAT2_015252 [Lamellibrachia satsuma]
METLRGRQTENVGKGWTLNLARVSVCPRQHLKMRWNKIIVSRTLKLNQVHLKIGGLLKMPVPVPLRSLMIRPPLKNPVKMSGHLAAPQS